MKKRIRGRRGRLFAQRGRLFDSLLGDAPRKRKSWTFERLEDRHYFSATPLAAQSYSLSNATPEGAAEIMWRELYWAGLAQQSTSGLTSRANFTDPLYSSQWHLVNNGQLVSAPNHQPQYAKPGEDINVKPVWERGYTGRGVVVGVIDSGVQLDHPDLIANLSTTNRYDAILNSNLPTPNFIDPAAAHGTAVAGIIAAAANNIGGVGVAPGATIAPIRLIDVGQTPEATVQAFAYAGQNVDITNNSWGPADTRTPAAPSQAEIDALRNSVIFGRDGKGVINVWASGNGAGPTFAAPWASPGTYDHANLDGYVNNRYTLAVSGIDHDGSYNNDDGTVTHYPESGANVFVAAPTGSFASIGIIDDFGYGSGITTTDFTGESGLNFSPLNGLELDNDYLAALDYTSRFNGTSAAAPVVAGVIALMLEANPELTWRDVQEIMVRSARQAGQFEIPQTGGGLIGTNSWQLNPLQIFRDPDAFVMPDPMAMPPIVFNPTTAQRNPVADPFFEANHFQNISPAFASGAGYTISEGFGPYSDRYGYGHGVVDADLAVKLSEQWHTKQQNLPDERTFTTYYLTGLGGIGAGQVGNNATAQLTIPGGWGGNGQHAAYWNEYFEDDPFSGDNPPTNTRGAPFREFVVPTTWEGEANTFRIEHVEIRANVTGNMAGVRLLLVSPNGTYTELTPYYRQLGGSPQGTVAPNVGVPAVNYPAGWTFSTNRNWGERSDNAIIYDSVTGNPIAPYTTIVDPMTMIPELDPITGLPLTEITGVPLMQGWRLYAENYSGAAVNIGATEVAWHGSPIDPNSKRIQGFVGIDENQDKYFNFSRTILSNGRLDPLQPRFGDLFGIMDPDQEKFAANVTVQATRLRDGEVMAEFVTGADGNYYFDLLPDDYIISISEINGVSVDDLDGTMLLADPLTPAGYVPAYRQQWRITTSWFNAWNHVPVGVPGDFDYLVPIDDDIPVAFRPVIGHEPDPNDPNIMLPIYGDPTPDHLRNINFLLDVGAPPPNEVVVTGRVFADINGDGAFNGDDVGARDFIVYADTNRSGAFESTDSQVRADESGNYTLKYATTDGVRFTLGAEPPSIFWAPTNPTSANYSIVGYPGDTVTGKDFAFRPANGSGNATGNAEGSILGVAFQDKNGDGIRQANEAGISGLRVFVDRGATPNGVWNPGEPFATTAANGAYFLTGIAPGNVRVDIVEPPTWQLLSPADGYRDVPLLSDGTATNVSFGLKNLATHDWGDLAGYPTLASENGPRHFIVPGFQLGAKIDGETEALVNPTAAADGDDAIMGDEDGVVITTNGGMLKVGANTLQVTLAGVGGHLNGWIDWNNDGDWTDAGEQVFVNRDLSPGTHNFVVTAPAGLAAGAIAARFRWGTANVSYVGSDIIGEVEDYRLANSVAPPVIALLPGDYDGSRQVDNNDYLLWKATFGTGDLRADGNNNGQVDAADFNVWMDHRGMVAAATVLAGDYDGNSRVEEADYLLWKATFGSTSDRRADGNFNGVVDAADFSVWHDNLGAEAGSGTGSVIAQGTIDPVAVRAAIRARARENLAKALAGPQWGQNNLDFTNGLPPSLDGDIVPRSGGGNLDRTALLQEFAAAVPVFTTISLHSGNVAVLQSPELSAKDDSALLLLDEAWSTIASGESIVESVPLASCSGKDEDADLQLALAAAFDDVTNWRYGL